MKQFLQLTKLKPGDQVAIVSPSAGLPGLFPWVQDLGIERLNQVFRLAPKEYPTTRQMGSGLKDRASDLMAAFADPQNKAVIASIGGTDQIKLLKHLDPQVFTDNPKPFFGFSDNTHFINYLWNLSIPAYYGGCVMTQYAMQGKMHDLTTEYLRRALFDTGEYELKASGQYNDEGLDWSNKENLSQARKMEENEGWSWDGDNDAEGVLWGGCVESLIVQSTARIYLPVNEDLEDTILFIETAEDIPEHWIVEYLLTGLGERGWFNYFQAVLVGRPKAWDFSKPNSTEQKTTYRQVQRETILKTVRQYNREIPIVQNIDFGHTDPQIVLPVGQTVKLNSKNKTIIAKY